ncbi:MAG: phosphoribosyltransferase [Candidatus Bathyarchaeia archaeon]
MPTQKMKCRLVSWNDVHRLCSDLAEVIEKSAFNPSCIVALARSGFVPGRLLSDRLGITDLISLKVEHWLDMTGQHAEEAVIRYRTPFDISGKRILVVDDIVDTGKSMKLSVEYLQQFNPAALKTAVMQYITSSIFKPDFHVMTVKDWVWFIYPWNYIEDMCNLTLRLLKSAPRGLELQRLRLAFKKNYTLEVQSSKLRDVLKILEKQGKVRQRHSIWYASA